MRSMLVVLVVIGAWMSPTASHAEQFDAMPISALLESDGVHAVVEANGKVWRLWVYTTHPANGFGCTDVKEFYQLFDAAIKKKQSITIETRNPLGAYDTPYRDQPRMPLTPIALMRVRIFDSDFTCRRLRF